MIPSTLAGARPMTPLFSARYRLLPLLDARAEVTAARVQGRAHGKRDERERLAAVLEGWPCSREVRGE